MKTRIIRLSTAKTWFWAAAAVAAGGLLLRWPEAAATGVSRGLAIASQILIPGLFPFIVLSGWLTRSGLCSRVGQWLARPMRWLGLPGCAAAVWLIGLVGGYPAGAAAISSLCRMEQLTPSQARRLLAGCVNAGPGFCVATVGVGMLSSARAGWILWAAHAVSSTVLLLLFRTEKSNADPPPTAPLRIAEPFTEAVGEAARSMLGMTGFVTVSSLLLSIMQAAALPDLITTAAACVTEVTGGCLGVLSSPFLLGWTLGWGGLSVHGQLASLLPAGILDGRFFLARMLHGCLAGLLTLWWMPPISLPTFSTLSGMTAEPFASASALGGVSLLVLCVTWLGSMRKKVDF